MTEEGKRKTEDGMENASISRKMRTQVHGRVSILNVLLLLLAASFVFTNFVVSCGGLSYPKGTCCGNVNATRANICAIATAINTFDACSGRLPDSLDELTKKSGDNAALLDKKFLKDSWGHLFQYKKMDKYKYEIRSAGPDGELGTADDLTN